MFIFTTGDLLQSRAEALVNTVNCEGYMGKGIAYQFKLQFPQNNVDYIKACRNGSLYPGRLHYFREREKIIINFPTKNKWREKSKLQYIKDGLDQLIILIDELGIDSIAIPPLGSGNGGLIWSDVKSILLQKLEHTAQHIDIYIYEPSQNFHSAPLVEPKLSVSALVLMELKHQLRVFNKFRLQKSGYFMNLAAHKEFFKFTAYKYGPYDHSIDIVSQRIREFQQYHGTKSTEEAKAILYNKLVSDSVNNAMEQLLPAIEKSCAFVNGISTDHELECLSTICFLIEHNGAMSSDDIILGFKQWSKEKAGRFKDAEILHGIETLCSYGLLEKQLSGYNLSNI